MEKDLESIFVIFILRLKINFQERKKPSSATELTSQLVVELKAQFKFKSILSL